jgi:hypothetical protein
MRRKAAAAPVILNTKKPTDASMFIQKTRLAASGVFRLDGSEVGTTITANDRSGNGHMPASYVKKTGKPADASDFTAFLGSQGIRDDAAFKRGRILTNSTDASSVSTCVPIAAPVAPKQASQFGRELVDCHAARGDPISNKVFVDNTIRLSAGQVPCATNTTHIIHDVKDQTAFPKVPNRPSQAGGQYAVIGPVTTSPDDARKVGAPVRSFNLPYVEKHHGNDLNVNPKRPFVPFRIPAGAPAHLKINDPKQGIKG